MKQKRILNIIIFFTYVILQEIIFSLLTVKDVGNIVLKILFCFSYAIIADIVTSIFSEKTNKKISYILMGIITLIYIVYDVYYQIFGNALSFTSIINAANQSTAFASNLMQKIIENWYQILILCLPYIAFCIASRKLIYTKRKIKEYLILVLLYIIIFIGAIVYINFASADNDIYSPKNLYYNINNPIENLKCFGLMTYVRMDLQRKFFGFEEKNLYVYQNEEGEEKVIDTSKYNITDIDFDNLISQEENEEIKEVYEYLKKQSPSNKNEYTGKFEGKNLIVFVAESFSNLAIREDITPTLYKLAHQGFQFENFYTPLFPVSTADGEYLTDTSLLPAEGLWSIENVEGKTFPYSYANVLKNYGYSTYAYHDYEYDYYKRDKYFKTMGYDTYLAEGNGLENRMDFSKYPASDLDMVKSTMKDYIHKDKFVAYYMTISGHINYDKSNNIVVKNWDKVKNLPYSDKAKAYLATQIEFDKAIEEVLRELEEAGKLNDTVIIITGDHYPYGLSMQEMQELANNQLDYFEKFNMPFIIYNGDVKEDIIVEKYASSLDVLPTILNLFGVEFDSRLLMGRDIFSDSEPLVIFSDRSFITDKGRYNSLTEKFESFNGSNVDVQKYVEKIKEEIYHKYRCSRLILENDIYSKLL